MAQDGYDHRAVYPLEFTDVIPVLVSLLHHVGNIEYDVGVTDGGMLSGVRFGPEVIETETIVYRSITGTVRRIYGEHREFAKFKLD